GHRDRRWINGDQWQWLRVLKVGEGLADHDVFDTCNCNDLAWSGFFSWNTGQTLGCEQLGDLDLLHGAILACPVNLLALAQGAVDHAQQCQTAKEWRSVEVGDVSLQNFTFGVGRCRNVLDDGLEQWFEIFVVWQGAIARLVHRSVAGLARGEDDRYVQDR